MEQWKEYKLGDLYEVHNGLSKSGKFFGAGFPFLSFKTVFNNYFLPSKLPELVQSDEKEQNRYDIKRGDVFVTRTSETPEELGMSSVALKDYPFATYNGFTKRLRPKDISIVHPEFIGYYLRSFKFRAHFYGLASSMSTRASLANGDLLEMKVFLPSIGVQKRISTILKSLDDKIEINRRINDNFIYQKLLEIISIWKITTLLNDNLEQQAQALFNSWFVDFQPFKNQQFIETEFGNIPQCLLTTYVSEIPHTLETGRRPKGGVGELTLGIPSVGAEHVKGLGNYDFSKTKYITEEYASTLKTGKVNGYELLIYKDGGKPGYFIPNFSIFGEGYPYDECYLNEHVFKLDFGNKGYNAFCYFFFKTDYVMNYLNAQGGKAAIPGINRQDIENIHVFSPQNESVKEYGDIVLPMIKQILFNCKESHRLAVMRDHLLPKLMSGGII